MTRIRWINKKQKVISKILLQFYIYMLHMIVCIGIAP